MAFYLGDKLIIDPDVKLERVLITLAEYDALAEKKDNIVYVIIDAPDEVLELKDTTALLELEIEDINQRLDKVTLLNLVAYGVEWDVNVADPHLTRIGNPELHKTLPILSQMKGCIALGGKIMYWLDENDWRFKKTDSEPTLRAVTLATTSHSLQYAGYILLDMSSPYYTYLKVDNIVLKYVAVVLAGAIYDVVTPGVTRSQAVQIILDVINNKGGRVVGATAKLDGTDGTVRVYCPEFYIKSEIDGNKRRVWVTTYKIDETWTHLPAVLIDAYRCTVLNETGSSAFPTGSYLASLRAGSAISVANTDIKLRGGNNAESYDRYLTGANNTSVDIFRSNLGKPRTAMSRAGMRRAAAVLSTDSHMLSYDQYKNIFYWLYVIEYANFNCQEAYNGTLTSNGYHQGGLGLGITTMANWGLYNNYNPITPCGYGDDMGNNTGIKNLVIPEFSYTNASIGIGQWTVHTDVVTLMAKDANSVSTNTIIQAGCAFSTTADKVWGDAAYRLTTPPHNLKILFKIGDSYDTGTLVAEATVTNSSIPLDISVSWPLKNYGGKRFIGFENIPESMVDMSIFTTEVASETLTQPSLILSMPRWRGFDNPFGDIWTNLDGIIIDADADNHPNNMNYVYTCQDPDKFADALNESYKKVGEEIHQDGYTKLFDLGDAAHIIPKVIGANTTTYKCDYHWPGNKNATLRTLLVGGGATYGSYAGLGCFRSDNGVSYAFVHIGFRSVSVLSSVLFS